MMKKTLIATAVASAFSLNAFADGHVSINGYAASGFEFGDSETGGVTTDGKTAPLGGNTFVTLQGSNDLDNGSQSYILMGFTTDITDSGSGVAMRFGKVGLRGDFGDVSFGSGEQVYEVGQIIDPHIADFSGNSLTHTQIAGDAFSFTRIDDNVLVYSMNQIGVVKPTIVYGYGATDEDTTETAATGGLSTATYDDGVLQVALDWNNGAGMGAQFAYAAYTDVDPINTSAADDNSGFNGTKAGAADATGMRVTGTYDSGGYIIKGTFQQLELDHAVTPTGYTNTNYNGKTWERDTMYLSLIVPVATGRIGAGYGTAGDVSVDGSSVDESGSKVYSLTYQYDLSANTYLFARFAKTSHDAEWTTTSADSAESTTTSQIIGLKVSF